MLDDENRETDDAEEETTPAPSEEPEQAPTEEKQKNSISADLIRGHINTIILRTLSERDKYGYEIIDEIEKKSHGQYELKQPTLYSALKRLENQGYIKAYWKTDEISAGGRRKYFTLTDSGREITEKNRAEWEYSRTVIDSLISDQAFDFSKPAPTPVDFKILKKSTSRVPNLRYSDDDDEEESEQGVEKAEENKSVEALVEYSYAESLTSNLTLNEIQFAQQITEEQKPAAPVQNEPLQQAEQPQPETIQPEPVQQPVAAEQQPAPEQTVIQQEPVQQAPAPVVQQTAEQAFTQSAPIAQQQPQPEAVESQAEEKLTEDSAQYKKLHENYLKLIDENYGKEIKQETPSSYGENLDTEKLIYNNKPVTERDYKNLINDMYSQTLRSRPPVQQPAPAQPQQVQQPQPAASTATQTREPEIKITPAPAYKPRSDEAKWAENDGLKIYTSDRQVKSSGKYSKSYNIGETLLKCSGVVFAYLMLIFVISLVFRSSLGVTLAYPFIIFAIACCMVMVCGVMTLSGFGKNAVKPVTHGYIAISIVLTIIAIFIVCVVAILLNVNFGSAADVCKMMVIPSLVLLSAPIFTGVYYLFTK